MSDDEDYHDSDSDRYQDDDEEHMDSEKRKRPRGVPTTVMNNLIKNAFEKNQHPSVETIHKIASENGKYFSKIYEMFDKLRNSIDAKCSDDCVCLRIKGYLAQNKKNYKGDSNPNKVNVPKEKLIEIFSRVKEENNGVLKIGEFCLIAEETKLPIHYLRARYHGFNGRVRDKTSRKRKIEEWEQRHKDLRIPGLTTKHVMDRQASGNNYRIPTKVVKELEKEFKKSRKCSAEVYKRFFDEFNLSRNTVRCWFERQQKKTALPIQRKDGKIERRHTFTEKEKKYLNERFAENIHPSREQYFEMAKALNLTFVNVSGWFMQRRTAERKKMEREALKDSIENMSEENEKRLKSILGQRRQVKFNERMELARELGLPYEAVTLWFEEKIDAMRNKIGQRRSRRKRVKKEETSESEDDDYDSEASLEYDEEAHWQSIEQLAKNAKSMIGDDDEEEEEKEEEDEEDEEGDEEVDEQ